MSNGKTVAIEIELLDRISGGLDRVNKKLDALEGGSAEAKKGLSGLENMSDRVKRSLMGLGMAFSMKGLVSEVANVRGQFQQLEVAFNTMLGSADKAEALMAQLVRTAATTPFDLEGVAQGAKQLLAYGMEAEKVNETLIRLGDIAAGLSMPLNDLVYLYGTTMAQGRLYTQDLNQFTGRGIPMIQELAKVFGVAESKVKDLVEAGKVGFPEVQKVIENLTGEGSKFGGLMEEQSKTISGQIRNIKDDIASMFNDMGKQSEGVINTTLSGVTYIVEHYEQFGRVLMGLVATYGTYRTACMTVAAVQSLMTTNIGAMTAAEAIHHGWIVMVEKAQKLLNATMLSNPYVSVATAIASVIAVMVSMKTETELMQAADEDYEAQKQKVIEAEEEHKRKMEELCSIAGDEALSTDTRREALNRLEQKYPSIFAKYDTEYEKLRNIKKIKQEIAELEAGQSIAKPKNELGNVNKRIQELEAKQKTERWKMSYGSYHRVGGLSRAEEAELKSLQQRQQNLNKQVRKDAVNAYFEDLTGVSNNDLKKQIKERENLMARMKMSGRKYGYTTNDGKNIRGTYTMDELQYQLNKLRSERNRRNEPRRSSSDWGAADKKAYQAALKEYNDFVRNGSNNLTKEEYDKKAKELKEKTELAKKEYDSRKAGTAKDSDRAEKDAAKAEAAEERRKQVKEKVGQELVALQRKNDKEEIDTMQEGLEKKLRQIENDYQAQKDAIDKQETAWKRDNKKAGIATEANGLTKEQTDAIKEANALNEKSRSKAIEDANKEALKEELLAMTDYLKEYGTIQEQKYAIAKEYAEKIKEANEGAGTAEEKKWKVKALEKQRDAAMGQADAKSLAMNIDWGATFDGVGNVLKDVARETLGKVEEYMDTAEFKALSAENKKTYTDLQAKLKQETGGESTSAFNFKIWDTIAENVRTYQLNQQETNANYLGMAYAQAGYWNKHRSWKHYWKGFTGEQTEWIKQNVKGDFNGSIWSLSPEEMKKLLGNVGIAEYIKNTGKGGYGAKVLDKLQDYAAQAGKLEELTDSWRETVTQISFESMKDSFMSNLMDMKKGSKDFAEGFATDMQKALLSYSMEDLVNGKLKKLYDDWAKTISEKNGELTEKDIEDFNRRYDEIVAEGLKRRDEWAKVTGYEDASGTSQSAKAGGFSAMTQEQGTKLEGMFVSGLQHWSSMDERLETVAERMSVAESHLARIAENTGTSAEHLGEIKEEIRKIVRDGLKVK